MNVCAALLLFVAENIDSSSITPPTMSSHMGCVIVSAVTLGGRSGVGSATGDGVRYRALS